MTGEAGARGPVRFESPSGLAVMVNRNGSLRRIEHRDVVLNTFPGTEIEGGPTNLYLRRHGPGEDDHRRPADEPNGEAVPEPTDALVDKSHLIE
jgi:hypothetical protein